jgi:hypothetical protein
MKSSKHLQSNGAEFKSGRVLVFLGSPCPEEHRLAEQFFAKRNADHAHKRRTAFRVVENSRAGCNRGNVT